MRGRVFSKTVARMRIGQAGDWTTDRTDYDKAIVKRLMSRVAYGGRKGHRAFLRLWQMRIRPAAIRLRIRTIGFEVSEKKFVSDMVSS